MVDKIWSWMVHTGMPIVYFYHLLTGNIFLNISSTEASGLEKMGNTALIPFQYIFAGKEVYFDETEKMYHIRQRFNYSDKLIWMKTIGCAALLPSSITYGAILKGISYISSNAYRNHENIKLAINPPHIKPNSDYYKSLGLQIANFRNGEWIDNPEFKRRPGDEHNLATEKEALKQIIKVLSNEEIPFWVDCGTCLGAYRYGGGIPWDHDIDIAILQPDFENVKNALNKGLNPEKYQVQDWSSRDRPNTYLKVYIKETKALIDIYHCAIDEKKGLIYTIVSNENCIFLPESWKIRERRCAAPVPISVIFPLKQGYFEDIIVPIPNKPKEYLQSKYGENISPAKIYNEKTGQYEKDLSHPYWQLKYAN